MLWGLTSEEIAAALKEKGSVTVLFEVSAPLKNVGFWLTPSLQAFLDVLTPPFTLLEPGKVYDLELAWKGSEPATTIGGTLHLVPVDEEGSRLRRTYPQPLAVNVRAEGSPADPSSSPGIQDLTIVDSVSYAGPPIAPLQIVSIYGLGIGPEVLQSAVPQDGKLADYLADVQVLFDGTAAPIIFVSATELKVVVPSDVAGKDEVTVTVTFRGKAWELTGVPVSEAAPAIFSMNGLGHGLAMAYDSNGQAVTEENPAKPGDTITFFGTGVGLWKDGFIDGTISDPENLPVPKKPVEVKIGGAAAELLYVGGAPGLVNAVVQFTVVVPTEMPDLDTSTNPATAFIVAFSGGHPTKAELFIYISM